MFIVLWNLVAFLVAIGVLITVHELGHFCIARLFDVRVERFCIGFGRELCKYTDCRGTEYVVALIPLGGYVKMLDERVGAVSPEYRNQSFNNKPIWQRTAIIIFGPISNLLFAIFFYWLVLIIGIPTLRPIINEIIPKSIAEKSRLLPGMEFKSVNGIETPNWESVRSALLEKTSNIKIKVSMTSLNSFYPVIKTLDLREFCLEEYQKDPVLSLGIIPYSPKIELVIDKVQPNSVAEKAGLRIGDRLAMINKKPISNWESLVTKINDSPAKTIALEINRNGRSLLFRLTPDIKVMTKGKPVGFIGINPRVSSIPKEYKKVHRYECRQALYKATYKTWQLIRMTVSMLCAFIIGDLNISNLSGPITIAKEAGASAESGLVYYLIFLSLISINLGIINLLPIPALDGGHLLFLVIEKLQGRLVSERVQDYSHQIGLIVLTILTALALFNDFSRL